MVWYFAMIWNWENIFVFLFYCNQSNENLDQKKIFFFSITCIGFFWAGYIIWVLSTLDLVQTRVPMNILWALYTFLTEFRWKSPTVWCKTKNKEQMHIEIQALTPVDMHRHYPWDKCPSMYSGGQQSQN